MRPRVCPERRPRGQSIVEFALVLPIMLLILAAAVDVGRLFYAFVAVENAAKEGALFGSRNPLCGTTGIPACANPNNVVWHVQNEAANIGADFTTQVACREKATGDLVQPINDCVDGDSYQVTVSYPFRLLMPIIGSIIGPDLILRSQSQATVIADAFDPSGLEALVWVKADAAENAPEIAAECTEADPIGAPNFYYGPCQDSLNLDRYLIFAETTDIDYRVRLRNTGNIDLTGLTYAFTLDGVTLPVPGTCGSLPGALAATAPPILCDFTLPATVTNPLGGADDQVLGVTAQGLADGVPTGQTASSATVRVIPIPRLEVNLRAAPYRLGGDGDGLAGAPFYANGPRTLDRDPASAVDEIRDPTGWLYLTVVNQGGVAANFTLEVTEDGTPISLPGRCVVPTMLEAKNQPGSTFGCIFPRTFTTTDDFDFVATADADNAIIVPGEHPAVTITTATCPASTIVIPNLVDTLTPSPDLSNKTVGDAEATWLAAGFTGQFLTLPPGQPPSTTVESQATARTAYACADPASLVTVSAP